MLHILTDAAKQTILTVSALNVPTEYELSYTVQLFGGCERHGS